MFGIAPPFWAQLGDHPAGDGLTIFQTTFAGAVSNDVSVSAMGAGTELAGGGTKNNGYYESTIDSVSGFGIYWSGTALSLGLSQALTAEMFVRVIEVAVDPASTNKIAQLTFGTSMSVDFIVDGYSGGINPMRTTRTGSSSYTTAYDVLEPPYTGLHHLAVVFRTTGLADVYIDGVRGITGAGYGAAASGLIQLGGSGSNFASRIKVQWAGGRVRRAEMYSGASFTPPIDSSVWGPP